MKREVPFKSSYLGKRAVVVGAGLGGLSAARALSDYFDEVMILDRDELPDDAISRPGVPQGKHPHNAIFLSREQMATFRAGR
jgi:glycine/D-amino acid oxidase-like deaminating enzyme